MAGSSNKIKQLIEKKLLMPAYVGMVAGLLTRSVALILSASIPYSTWPGLLRVAVEGMAAVGMVGCADIVLSVSASTGAFLDHQIALTLASPQYLPNPRLSREKYEREKLVLDAKRQLTLTGLKSERQKERISVFVSGFITVMFGGLFAFTILGKAGWVPITTEIIGVSAVPFITWYLSAQYKEEESAQPAEKSKQIVLAVVDERLDGMKKRFADGSETPADISLMDAATEESEYHNRLVKRLAAKQAGVRYLSTPEIYKYFGAEDPSTQATIRRIVREAGKRGDYGVMWDDEKKQWITPSGALDELFPQERLARRAVAAKRTRPDRYRKSAGVTPDDARANAELRSEIAQQTFGESAPAAPTPMPAERLVWSDVPAE